MARTSTYLNFVNQTEEAFLFYKSVFGGEFVDGMHRMGEIPPSPDMPELDETAKNLIMHVDLEILGGHHLMGTDSPESLGFKIVMGNNVNINLEPDTRAETDALFAKLSAGGTIEMPLQEMFWEIISEVSEISSVYSGCSIVVRSNNLSKMITKIEELIKE
jgi:PhnB protein